MATSNKRKVGYQEPMDYFPKEIRKKAKLGEYAETKKSTKKKVKKATKSK